MYLTNQLHELLLTHSTQDALQVLFSCKLQCLMINGTEIHPLSLFNSTLKVQCKFQVLFIMVRYLLLLNIQEFSDWSRCHLLECTSKWVDFIPGLFGLWRRTDDVTIECVMQTVSWCILISWSHSMWHHNRTYAQSQLHGRNIIRFFSFQE
jgi:hypothetical protein